MHKDLVNVAKEKNLEMRRQTGGDTKKENKTGEQGQCVCPDKEKKIFVDLH